MNESFLAGLFLGLVFAIPLFILVFRRALREIVSFEDWIRGDK